MLKPLLASCTVMIMIFSCKHESTGEIAEDRAAPAVCFEQDVLPVFQSHCAKSGCHNASSHEDGYTLDTYDNITATGVTPGNASSSLIYIVLNATGDNKMPKDGDPQLTNDQKLLIRRWINQGAANTSGCGAACDSSTFTYSNDVKPILDKYCTGCHGGTSPQGDFVLDTYVSVKEYVDGDPETFMATITREPGYAAMPKAPAAKLSDCNIAKIKKWIEAGAPNN